MNLTATLHQLERELESIRRQPARLELLLGEDFREFGSSGRVFSRAQILVALQAEQAAELQMEDFEVLRLTEDLAQVTYRTVERPSE